MCCIGMSLNCMSKGLTWKKCCRAVAKISRCWVYAIGRQGMLIVGDGGGDPSLRLSVTALIAGFRGVWLGPTTFSFEQLKK